MLPSATRPQHRIVELTSFPRVFAAFRPAKQTVVLGVSLQMIVLHVPAFDCRARDARRFGHGRAHHDYGDRRGDRHAHHAPESAFAPVVRDALCARNLRSAAVPDEIPTSAAAPRTAPDSAA